MERMLVAIFHDKAAAHKASEALQNMSDEGAIAVHSIRLLTCDVGGAITVDRTYDALPEGTMGATAVGTLLGLLGGPVGLAIGAASGMIVGATADYAKSRVTEDFAQHVADELTPGRSAMVAELYEESTDAVDAQLHGLGATIFRRDLSDVADTEYEHEISTIKSDLADVKAEMSAKRANRRARLHAKTDPVIKKLDDKLTRD